MFLLDHFEVPSLSSFLPPVRKSVFSLLKLKLLQIEIIFLTKSAHGITFPFLLLADPTNLSTSWAGSALW